MNEPLRRELIAMDEEDQRVRDELARDGSLFDGYYHPRMEEVHKRNAARLKEVIAEHGWPNEALVGKDGAFVAWRLLQHSIGDPAFMRGMLPILWEAARKGEIPAAQPAYLEDRILMYEGKPQLYGSQFWPDETGVTHPWEIADPENLDKRRAEVGLEPFAERLAAIRRLEAMEGLHPPSDHKKLMADYEAWLRRSGWRPPA